MTVEVWDGRTQYMLLRRPGCLTGSLVSGFEIFMDIHNVVGAAACKRRNYPFIIFNKKFSTSQQKFSYKSQQNFLKDFKRRVALGLP